MELDELERSAKRLSAVVDEFPIGAASLDDFKPVGEKIQATRVSLMHLNARLLMLRAKYKRTYGVAERPSSLLPRLQRDFSRLFTEYVDDRGEDEAEDALQTIMSDTLINARALKLCLHSTTILSILSNKEGTAQDQR